MARSPVSPAPRPRVALLSTGGTIAHQSAGRYNLVEYLDTGTRAGASALSESFPEVADFADVTFHDFASISSRDMGPDKWTDLRLEILRIVGESDDLSGLVVTHGTATLEETAFFLDLTVGWHRPVVVVGAQRPPNTLGSDAPANLVSAVVVASAESSLNLGTAVVMNNQIYSPREVSKNANSAVDAFGVAEFGYLGYVNADYSVSIYQSAQRLHGAASRFAGPDYWAGLCGLPRVDIIPSYAGADAVSINAAVAAGAQGLIVDALPPGLWSTQQQTALLEAVQRGVAVVYVTRAGSGTTMVRPKLRDEGFVAGDNLTAKKARILLMLALNLSADPVDLQTIFDEY